MKKKYKVTLYQETYTEVVVSAESESEAGDLVLAGEYEDGDVEDIAVKESFIASDGVEVMQ
jgi:hypothetical protein|tara:strand:+ start:127 stop:309 length:183 start_codon:yes stop_codon:yes gene_type:complete